ncbi:hypothetical protein Q5P01_022422 [Channa striata]|uniref:Zonadhesin n=1 Tax=Channa striata TaxID=64152 RepID=A0AA88LMJ3_CHASR|nr:hypothetical protein Q5P01_022422 [Channa striata]
MVGGMLTDLLVTVTLLFVAQTGRAENDLSLVALPDWKINSHYVTKCFYDKHTNLICDWERSRKTTKDTLEEDIFDSGSLELEGEGCLEFWYLNPTGAKESELRALLKSSAGQEQIWTSPALPRNSWRQVFVPLKITEPRTRVVLEAVSIREQIAFKQFGVRRGTCGHQCESNTELWTDESTRCLCSAGQLSCFPSQCPKGHICGPQSGSSSGNTTSGTCTIHSHTECSTFDGVLFRFTAPCTYVLAKTCSPTEALPMFNVEVVNGHNGNSTLTTIQQITVNTGNFRVSLLKRETQRVVVNGIWRRLPLSLSSGTVNIKSNPAAVLLRTSFGLSVSFDNAGAVHVTLPFTYSDKVCGLCGNFNHFRDDDFHKPHGTDAQIVSASGESWQTEQTRSSCETILIPHQCDPLVKEQYASEPYCGGLLSSTGPFTECQSVVGAASYFRGCVASMCTTHGDPAVLCEIFQAYADICQEAGVTVPIWRNSTVCPLQCGNNSYYNSCADGCPEVCSSLDTAMSCGSCEERCECDFGFKLSGGKCVPPEDCGCWYNGKHYQKGATVVEGECVQQCQCTGNNYMRCTSMKCAPNEVCKVKDGVKDCFPFKPATCSVYGDPHFITFDKKAYDFQGGCSYTLTTTCGGQSSVHFTVIGHNIHPPLQNFTRSKLEAVTLQIEDLSITLNQSGKVYRNSSHIQLPYSIYGTFGSIRIYLKNNYITLETTFGLQMMIDGQNRLFLKVDEHYKYDLCGLCGTYSGHQGDDFITPGGQNVNDAFQFGDSWRVQNDDVCIAYPNHPRVCDNEVENEAYRECYTLLGRAFESCHETIHPSIYLQSCVYDYCATNGDQHTLCDSLKSYAAACQVAGVELPPWQAGTACAEVPTTAPPPISPTPTSPPVCPMNCDFEKNLCGWEQLVQDSFDWTMHSGPTPSNQTGPNQDHTTGDGFYMYIEGNSVMHGDSARLLSSICYYNGPLCLQFWYHMYGSATAMALNIYLLKDKKATKVWSMMNTKGPEWHPGNVDIRVSGPFQIIVEGIRGSNAQSDVAIDDISIHFGSCSGHFPRLKSGTNLPSITADVHFQATCSLDCTFDNNICSWTQMITDAFDWTWQSGSTPTQMTGPLADHTGGGHYLYIEASSVTHGDTARLISSQCFESGPQCLQFWYHMYGSADTMGLHVYLYQDRRAKAVWRKRNDQGNMWHLAQVDLTTTGAFQIIFEGRRGSNDRSDVAIDDVKLYRGVCSGLSGLGTAQPQNPDQKLTAPTWVPLQTTLAPEPSVVISTVQPPIISTITTPPLEATTSIRNDQSPALHPVCQMDCDFEQGLCEWSQMPTDVFDWTRHSGSTPTMMTGPSSDHTTGTGQYLYIEANTVTHGDTARLISSQCFESGPQCLQFWYHMYGSADTMGLHVYLYQDRRAEAVWRKRNDQGNMWHLAQVDLTTTGAFQYCSAPIISTITTPPLEATTSIRNDQSPALHPVCQMDCDFEQGLCEWSQMPTDVFDWTRHSGSTPTMMTGPSSDHTTGTGQYLYIEANTVTHGDTARLISSQCFESGPQCLQFWYHMYGSADTMGLHVYLYQDRRAEAVWRKRNDQGNMWHLAQVDLTTTGAFQIIFEGRRGSNDRSDVAIDDVTLYRGVCSPQTQKPDQNLTAPRHTPLQTSVVIGTFQPPIMNPNLSPVMEAQANIRNNRSPALHPACQMDCDFEYGLCEWSQMPTDVFDWTRHSGSTPTMLTGPSSDHTTGTGHYLYIEANTVTHGDTARLISSQCFESGPQCLQFWYHMYGSADTMGLHVYLYQDRRAEAVWRKRNDQGNMWHLAQVDLTTTGAFQIIFEGRRGSNDRSDVAIDDIKLYRGVCSGLSGLGTAQPQNPDQKLTTSTWVPLQTTLAPEPSVVIGTVQPPIISTITTPPLEATTSIRNDQSPALHPVCQMDCDFEQGLCEWSQMPTDVFDWTRHSGSTPTMMTGPSSDHTTGTGQYLYIEANTVTHGDTARLISSQCFESGPQCLQFWYHMYGSADTMGLHVYLYQDRRAEAVWRKRNDQGNMWHLAQVDLTTTGAFQIIFEGRRGSNDRSDVALDDVKLYRGVCSAQTQKPDQNLTAPRHTPLQTSVVIGTVQPPIMNPNLSPVMEAQANIRNNRSPALHPVCQMDCDFEYGLCEWSQMPTDVFDWTRHSGSTPTMLTGPSSDHTTGTGQYLYIEANTVTHGDTARLISSQCFESGPQCLQFWYHMYGSADTMGLHVYLYQDRRAEAVWRKRNDQGNMWHLAQVDLTTTGAFQIIFEGRRGSNDRSDVAIDDIKLYRGVCSGLSGLGTAQPQNPDQKLTAPTWVPLQTTLAPEPSVVIGTVHPPIISTITTPPLEATTSIRNDRSPALHPVCQMDCDFEQGLCEWSQMPTDVFDWTRHSGSTPTMMTGPSSDHTTGTGQYLYIEANTVTHGDTARLISSQCFESGPQCLQFWYHMYGSADTMGLHVYLYQDRRAEAVWRKRNDQGNMWHLAQVDLTTTGAFQIIFEGRRGSTDRSDVAIDDVSLHRGHCAAYSCPKNSHYTTCIPACSPTCTYLNGPPHCSDSKTCMSGCVCDEGFVKEWEACVPIQQCGCIDRNGTKHQFNEAWYTNHCSQKCECGKDDDLGKIDCADKEECDGNAVCLRNYKGNYYCQSTGFSECTINGDPEYRTFDELKHGFEGEQSYVLVQTNNLPNNLPHVYIEGINALSVKDDDDRQKHGDSSSDEDRSLPVSNEEDDESEEHEKHYRLQELMIRVYNHMVVFKRNRKLVVDGIITNTPVFLNAGVKIIDHSSRIFLKTDFGLSVEFDGHSSAVIVLPHIYKRKVGGLCGNFDGQKWNDQIKPDGTRARNIQEFGESWKV